MRRQPLTPGVDSFFDFAVDSSGQSDLLLGMLGPSEQQVYQQLVRDSERLLDSEP